MKVVSVINYKGGVGKTTITANIAGGLAKRNFKVLVIDLDPQSNLTFSFLPLEEWKEHYSKNKTIKTWFENNEQIEFESLIINPKNIKNENLDLISSNIDLINCELELVARLYNNSPLRKNQNFLKVHQILKSGIDELEGYDVVIIDCPPNFNIITRNAIVTSDYYLVPVKLDYLSKIGLSELKKHIKDLTNNYNAKVKGDRMKINPELLGIVCNMVDRRKDSLISTEDTYLAAIKKDNPTFKSMLRQNKTLYCECQQELVPVAMKDIRSNNTFLEVKKEIDNLVEEFIERINLNEKQ